MWCSCTWLMLWCSANAICIRWKCRKFAPTREYGKTEIVVDTTSPLFSNVSEKTVCWMSHNDYISALAPGFKSVAHSDECPVAKM